MKIAHITIFTKCMEESVEFYEKMAGLKIQRDMRGTDHPIVFLAAEEGEARNLGDVILLKILQSSKNSILQKPLLSLPSPTN